MRNPYEYILREAASSVKFVNAKTEPFQGLPNEKIIACFHDGKLIAEIWPERDNEGRIEGYTVHPPAEYDERGRIRSQRTKPAPFSEKSFFSQLMSDKPSFGRPSSYPNISTALVAAKAFVKQLK